MNARRAARAGAVAAFALAAPRMARAGENAGPGDACRAAAAPVRATRHWPAPLDRTIALHARNVALRDALDRLAAAARIDLSYSSDLLPLDRPVCVAHDSVAAGDALVELLGDAPVRPVVTADDRVVLAPASPRAAAPEGPATVSVLARVLVTGSAAGTDDRATTVATQSVDGRRLEAQGTATLSDALDGAAAGIWMWQQSPTRLAASWGSVRGASSFGLSYPKIYIDGIEVANPLLLTGLSPETIDHVDVMRGPQEAALFGADAISGVVNIVTRHGGVAPGGDRATLRTSAGVTSSNFASHPVLVQHHTLSLDAGNELRSGGITVGVGTVGEFVPGAFSRELEVGGGARLVGSRASITGTVRFYGKDAGIPGSPLLGAPAAGAGAGATTSYSDAALLDARSDSTVQSVRQYTVGATATWAGNDRWTNSLVAGMDGYRLAGEGAAYTPIASPLDSALRAARGGADRATLRLTSVGRFGTRERLARTLSVAVEQSVLRERTAAGSHTAGAPGTLALWRSNTGLTTQGSAAWRDALFVTGGVRLERNDVYAGFPQVAALPMLGAAVVHDIGPVTAKLRGAYGRGRRAARTSPREIALLDAGRIPSLAPPAEEQSGVEGGVDLLVGRRFSLHATRFDQRAFGLIQPVAVAADSSGPPLDMLLQNVGAITNRGWELQSTVGVGRLALDGTLSLVDSRVQQTATDYVGELRSGDRMLGVPRRTLGLTASWTGTRWSGSVGASRASDWIDYDRLALARHLATAPPGDALGAGRLRDYWRRYGGVTRLRASFARELRGGIGLLLTGENLLDRQRGEPDDLTILPGRTITVGLQARF